MQDPAGRLGAAGPDDVLRRLLERSHALAPHELPAVVGEAAETLGVESIRLYVVDYDQRRLHPLDGLGDALGVDDTVAGSAYRQMKTRSEAGAAPALWLPVIDGAERVGVMRAGLEPSREPDVDVLSALASLAALLLHSKSELTDLYAVARRHREMSPAAEMQWELVPPLNYDTDRVGIACMLEPAYDIGGDTFDYSHNGRFLDFALLDGMGRGHRAMLYASTAMITLRHARREGCRLVDAYRDASETVQEQFGDSVFVTGQFGALDTDDGTLEWINSGHPLPFLIRGAKVVDVLAARTAPPLGVGSEAETTRHRLEAGDRVLFFTDGVTEARSRGGRLMGDRFEEFVETALAPDQPCVESLRRLMHRIRDELGEALRDDTTLMLIEYRGTG